MFTGANILCFIGGLLCIDKDIPHPKDDRKVDWLGAFLITAGLVMILFVLGDGEEAPKQWATGCMSLYALARLLIDSLRCLRIDIIALLVVGVLLVCAFLYWQSFLEKTQNARQKQLEATSCSDENGGQVEQEDRWHRMLPPPVMKISLWGRAKGRFAAVMAIAFSTWSSFMACTFWVQVSPFTHYYRLSLFADGLARIVVLPELRRPQAA